MSTDAGSIQSAPEEVGRPPSLKWFSERVHTYAGTLEEMTKKVPTFERRPFVSKALAEHQDSATLQNKSENSLHDMIVRLPLENDKAEVPVGIVSKRYGLIQHTELFGGAVAALGAAGIDARGARVGVAITEYGGRIALRFVLPSKYSFDPGDGEPLAMRLECFNSVDGSSRLCAMLGWFRFVCSNGLFIGTSRLNVRLVHNHHINVPQLADSLRRGFELVKKEQQIIKGWVSEEVDESQLVGFVDGPLQRRWGVGAAARAYLICTSGEDGRMTAPFEKVLPHEKKMGALRRVSGASVPAKSAYDVSQALAWLAKERRDVHEQVNWTRDIPTLMRELLWRTN